MRPLDDVHDELLTVLGRAQDLGFLGPKDIGGQLAHSVAFTEVVERLLLIDERKPMTLVDLGSGGGIPGLVIATLLPALQVVFVDSNQKRMQILDEHLGSLSLRARCAIVCTRAEEFGRVAQNRGRFDAVVARGFAGPGVTAECAAPLLRQGGWLVVSDAPNESVDRWPDDGLAALGLRRAETVRAPFHFFVGVQAEPCAANFPRRVGIPEKRPIF